MSALPFDVWTVISLLWVLVEFGLTVLLVGAAVFVRHQRAVSIALGVAALATAWAAAEGVISWGLWNVVGPMFGYYVAEWSSWVLRPISWVASLTLWVALAYAALAGRGPVEAVADDDPFAGVT